MGIVQRPRPAATEAMVFSASLIFEAYTMSLTSKRKNVFRRETHFECLCSLLAFCHCDVEICFVHTDIFDNMVVCEGNHMMLHCNDKDVLAIRSAGFGRPIAANMKCPSFSMDETGKSCCCSTCTQIALVLVFNLYSYSCLSIFRSVLILLLRKF